MTIAEFRLEPLHEALSQNKIHAEFIEALSLHGIEDFSRKTPVGYRIFHFATGCRAAGSCYSWETASSENDVWS